MLMGMSLECVCVGTKLEFLAKCSHSHSLFILRSLSSFDKKEEMLPGLSLRASSEPVSVVI